MDPFGFPFPSQKVGKAIKRKKDKVENMEFNLNRRVDFTFENMVSCLYCMCV